MKKTRFLPHVLLVLSVVLPVETALSQTDAPLPEGVRTVWDLDKAYREKTPTRERICINGLWRWQPATADSETVPGDNWGYFKVPGPWPKTRWARSEESQTAYPHPTWKDTDLSTVERAWYQREVTVPGEWAGRRIFLEAQYVNASAVVCLDGKKAGEIKSRGGRVDLTALCLPGRKQLLSIFVRKGPREFRGLCGDVYLDGVPQGARIDDVKLDTSVRRWQISADTAVVSLAPDKQYTLAGDILDDGKVVKTIAGKPFRARDLRDGRITFSNPWKPDKLWDIDTPRNQYDLKLRLLDASGKVLDEFRTVRFGFRELWLDGRDFRLNGQRLFCYGSPLDVGEVSAYGASYEGASKMISRFRSVGVNFAYTHNYSSVPGSHISFEEIMRACDDQGMLISLSQPQFLAYKWDAPDAEQTNGYVEDAEFYVRQAQNHPSVVTYSTSHNVFNYDQDQNPDRIDGIYNPWPDPEGKQMRAGQRGAIGTAVERIIRSFDSSRPLYHHSCGSFGQMYTLNCYLNFVPVQERSDWFEHWAAKGVKPLLLVEYGAPYLMSWTDVREWADLRKPYLWYPAEWGAQYRGDIAYQLPENERSRPNSQLANSENVTGVSGAYMARNWPAFRTWGVTLFNNWNLHYTVFTARTGAANPPCKVDWDNLQKPGFSADFINCRRWDHGYQDADWTPNREGEALLRYNQPLLAYIAGKPARFTSQDHNFSPGETVEKQVIVINNSRRTVACDCSWSLKLPKPVAGAARVAVETGNQARVPIRLALPRDLKSGSYDLAMTASFATGQTQNDVFTIHVLPEAPRPQVGAEVAVLDPKGETRKLLSKMGVRCSPVKPDADLAGFDVFIIGKHALTLAGPKLDLRRVRDGLKVVVFEQTNEVLEQRVGFRTQEYCLRQVFPRILGHPVLAGLAAENLRDWRGEGTTVPPRLEVPMTNPNEYPLMSWCGFTAPRAWRCGCRGSVASVLIEKPASGDFLPLIDGGFGLQYSPLLEYREGSGMVLFCQLDVTGRTEPDPAATRLVGNLLDYVSSWKPTPRRKLLYAGEAAGLAHLKRAGLSPTEYQGGPLTPDQVLVVAPTGFQKLAPGVDAVRAWVKAGGKLLALGLDQDQANAFLPFKVTTKKASYFSTYFEPSGMGSLLAGVGPADTCSREARDLALLTGGAAVLGDGVLAEAPGLNVAFYQLVPWQFDYEKSYNSKPSFRRSSFTLTRLLANMGVAAEGTLLKNLGEPLPVRALLDDIPNVVWLERGETELILPKVWKGLPVGKDEPPAGWETAAFDDRAWRNIKVPGTWEDQFADLVNLDGLFLYRVAFDVPADFADQEVTLVLGAVDDEDWTCVNGRFVGSITQKTNPEDYFKAVRRYKLPKGTLKAGRNVIAVKANDTKQSGGMKASTLKRRGAGASRWLSGLYLDTPQPKDDPYRYMRW